MSDRIDGMGNHPNRGGGRANRVAANPTPNQVAELRAESGRTQGGFGELVYKSWRIVQDWEGGARRMPPDTYELAQIKVKALKLLKSGRIAPADVRNLGIHLPEDGQ